MPDTTVKFFHWQMNGAPALTGAAGGLIPVLDACLVNGWGSATLDSLTISGGIATATRAAGHSAVVDGVQLIAGITGGAAALNGEQKVLSVTNTTFTFDATGVSNQTASGTITTKVAPLGYAKSFSGTNKAAYKPLEPSALGMYLRVNDAGTLNAVVEGYETMTDVDNGTGMFRTGTGGFWPKSSSADATARPWFIIGDRRSFFLWTEPNTATNSGVTSQAIVVFSGDLIPRRSSDAYAHTLNSNESNLVTNTGSSYGDMAHISAAPREAYKCPRSQTGLGAQQIQGLYSASRKFISGNATVSGDGSGFYPNAADNGLDLDEQIMTDLENNSVRGKVPGIFTTQQLVGFAFATFDRMDGAGVLAGRKLMFMRVGAPGSNSQNSTTGRYGVVAFDLTGPWR